MAEGPKMCRPSANTENTETSCTQGSPLQTMFFFTIHTVCLVPTSQWHYNPVNHKHFSICWQPVYSQKIGSLTNDDDDGSEKVAKK